MKCGVAMLSDALSWFTKVKLEAGYVVVLETAGRSGHWNPHLHILMTSGGMTPQKRWREVDYFKPCHHLLYSGGEFARLYPVNLTATRNYAAKTKRQPRGRYRFTLDMLGLVFVPYSRLKAPRM